MLKALVSAAGAHLMLATFAGCGASDRPPPSDSLVVDQAELITRPPPPPPPPREPGSAPPRLCEPRSYRECRVTYVDEDGQLHCPTDVEICSLDGATWLPCGMYTFDENHDPQPRHN